MYLHDFFSHFNKFNGTKAAVYFIEHVDGVTNVHKVIVNETVPRD